VLEECIHRERERREEDERETRQAMREAELTTLFSGLSAKPFWMNHADFFNLPTIQSLLTQDNYSIPVTQELQDFARPSIRKDIVDYELDILNRLIHLVKASSREIMRGDPVASLSSPTVFFSCKCCSGTLLTYPALLCRNKYSSTQRVVNDHLSFNIEASDVAQRILSAMAMDSNVYFSDLEKQFQCLRCDETWSETLTWSALVDVYFSCYFILLDRWTHILSSRSDISYKSKRKQGVPKETCDLGLLQMQQRTTIHLMTRYLL